MKLKVGQEIIDKIRRKKPHYELLLGAERLSIDGAYQDFRWYVWDYENVKNTITNNDSTLFIDIGANTGQSARKAYHFWGEDNIQVISYEPLKSCLDALEKIKIDHPSYIYKNIAVNDKLGKVIINEIGGHGFGETGLSSMLELNNNYSYNFNDGSVNTITNKIEVEATTITHEISYWESFKCKRKIIKIDTQGTELSILKAGENYLKTGNVDVIFIELMVINKYKNQCNHLDLLTFLESCGFVIYNINALYRELNGTTVGAENFAYGWDTEYDVTFVHKNTLQSLGMYRGA